MPATRSNDVVSNPSEAMAYTQALLPKPGNNNNRGIVSPLSTTTVDATATKMVYYNPGYNWVV